MPRIFSTKTIFSGTAAATGLSCELDFRDDYGEPVRAVVAALHASDSLSVEVSLDDSAYIPATVFTGTTAASALIAGPWRYIRVVKTGTNGTATVKVNG